MNDRFRLLNRDGRIAVRRRQTTGHLRESQPVWRPDYTNSAAAGMQGGTCWVTATVSGSRVHCTTNLADFFLLAAAVNPGRLGLLGPCQATDPDGGFTGMTANSLFSIDSARYRRTPATGASIDTVRSADGKCIVSGSEDRPLRLWDAATGQPIGQPLVGPTSAAESVAFSPDGRRIVAASAGTTPRLCPSPTAAE